MAVLSNTGIRAGAVAHAAASSDTTYQIEKSLRFNSGDSPKLSHTFGLGNIRTWTWSGWVKRNKFGAKQSIFGAPDTGNTTDIEFDSSDRLIFTDGGSVYAQTTAVFRDPSAWYHIVCSHDTTNSKQYGTDIPNERIKLYVNGKIQTVTYQTYALNSSSDFGTAGTHTVGSSKDVYSDVLLADVHYIDGMALSPAAFGAFDSTGAWNPKAFSLPAPNKGVTYSTAGTQSGNAPSSGAGPEKAFDGNWTAQTGFAGSEYGAAWNDTRWTLTDAIPVKSQVRIYTNDTGDLWGFDIGNGFERAHGLTYIGLNAAGNPGKPYIWTLPHTLQFKGICCSNSQQIFGVEVDGVMLRDGRTDPTTRNNINNGTQWSSQVSGTSYTGNGPEKAFDGSTGTLAQASNPGNASLTWVPTSAITGKVEILIAAGAHGGSVTGEFDLKIGNVSKFDNDIWPNNKTGWVDLGTQTIDTTHGLKWGNSTGGNWHGIRMIKIDGTPLVDSSYDNSFHLKFNDVSSNAAIGTDTFGNGNWTVTNLTVGPSNVNGITSTGTFESGRGALKAFNGLVGGTDYAHAASGQTCTISFTAVTGITKLRLNIAKNSGGDNWGTFELNDTDDITSWLQSNHGGNGNSGTWIDVTSQLTGTSLSKLEFTTSGNNDVRIAGVEVNDNLLVSSQEDDSLVDSPTNYGTDTQKGGEVRGNYCTLNPLQSDLTSLTQGNLDYTNTGGWKEALGTIGVTSGKWYYEVECVGGDGDGNSSVGFAWKNNPSQSGGGSVDYAAMFENSGYDQNFSTNKTNRSITVNEGDILGVSLDLDAGTPIMRTWVNDGSQNTINLGGTWSAGKALFPYVNSNNTGARWRNFNFGQRPWAYTCPSGYKALCTQNLSDTFTGDNVNNPSKYFNAKTYRGDGVDDRPLHVGFKPTIIWTKKRNGSDSHKIIDQLRGGDKALYPDSDAAESTQGGDGEVNSWTSTGVELNDEVGINQNDSSFVVWAWNAGDSVASTSNSGTNVTYARWTDTNAGFSVIKATTGSGAKSTTLDHGLGTTPSFMIIKGTDATSYWRVYHPTIGTGGTIYLDRTDAKNTTTDSWKVSAVSNTQFTFDSYGSDTEYMFYTWINKQGYSKSGDYIGNNSTDGPFIYTGFRPALVIVKAHDTTGPWPMYDNARGDINTNPYVLLADAPDGGNTNDAWSGSYPIDMVSNGFKLRGNTGEMNGANTNFIYMAWAEHPFKTARAK